MLPPQSTRWREGASGIAPPARPPARPPRAPSPAKRSAGGRAPTGPRQPGTRGSAADTVASVLGVAEVASGVASRFCSSASRSLDAGL